MQAPLIVSYNGQIRSVIRAHDDFGFKTFDLLAPPRRLLGSDNIQPLVESQVDGRRVQAVPTPASLLLVDPTAESWMSLTQRTMSRLFAAFLVAEDPQRRLDARKATTLMHQVSLVQHILEHKNHRKVLIADEVGLGKTIEAGLIIKRLVEELPNLRVLYLAPARLVTNVATEFRDKLDLDARVWIAGPTSDARVANDRIVVASIHKAVFGDNLQKIVEAGPWDVIIVDECHHLSDWGIEGGKPTQSFKLVDQLVQSMPPTGRLILMSGTPHQGSVARFKNLLRLLSDNRDIKTAAGRVIFRTKDMVSDWKNQPLFPSRQIKPPTIVSLGPVYENWYDSVGELYDSFIVPGSKGRATGWAKSQALQWAASSVQAGLGFLCRLGIRRLGWNLENEALKHALAELRPYRGGSPDEQLESLLERVRRQIGVEPAEISEEDEDDDETSALLTEWKPAPEALERLLTQGVELIRSGAASEKWAKLAELIDNAEGEKVVLFAQPVETVSVVVDFLKRRYGESPCFIIGNQADDERRQQVASFQSASGPKFLVSSRAGGEGLNMQRARRLIHLDVPWNPMELEQRVGRIHRFGSRKTIIVDTLVVAGSREVEMYRIAREKLRLIAKQLDPDQFDSLFSRVMSLVAPKELGVAMFDLGPGPVTPAAADEIGALVKNGYTAWQEFNDEYRSNAQEIQSTSGGEATWIDVGNHLRRQGEATLGPNTSQTRFTFSNEEIVAVDEELPTLKINGRLYACGDSGGLPPNNIDGQTVLQLGLNVDDVSASLKNVFLGDKPSGAAYLKRPTGIISSDIPSAIFGVLCFLKQTIRYENDRAAEERTSLHSFVVSDNEVVRLDPSRQASLLRELVDASRVREPVKSELGTKMVASELEIANSLRTLSESDIENRVRHVVLPLAAIIVA